MWSVFEGSSSSLHLLILTLRLGIWCQMALLWSQECVGFFKLYPSQKTSGSTIFFSISNRKCRYTDDDSLDLLLQWRLDKTSYCYCYGLCIVWVVTARFKCLFSYTLYLVGEPQAYTNVNRLRNKIASTSSRWNASQITMYSHAKPHLGIWYMKK